MVLAIEIVVWTSGCSYIMREETKRQIEYSGNEANIFCENLTPAIDRPYPHIHGVPYY